MAGHVQDRWYKTEIVNGKSVKVKSDRHGTGMRYRARYIGPDGTEKSKSFPDRQKRKADEWLANIEADMSRGQYVDPQAGRITFKEYAEKWMAAQTTDHNTRSKVKSQVQRHAIPLLGSRPMSAFRPSHIREWLSELESALPASGYRRVIFSNVSAIFAAAVDDKLISTNPCRTRTVTKPAPAAGRVQPWSTSRVLVVRAALPDRFQAMVDVGAGCGLRQGEIFGLPVEGIDFDGGWLHVVNQVKIIRGRLMFAPPKGHKLRDVPMSDEIAARIKSHMERFPPQKVTLPWLSPDGEPVTKELVFPSAQGKALRSAVFNDDCWKPALVVAGVIPAPKKNERHGTAREDGMHALRHFFASVLLDAGENVKAASRYLGHSDPGFTLRVYTHLMPTSEGRTRKAIDSAFRPPVDPDGPETAQHTED